ncbi:hypothetical protein EV385_0582 [Krasilnikovia cinnamomea]|uniref:YopA central domain-containing protein n=1 Tax=Krasilnikovia cinnamomea TaxID=349313 RepID=A0A4Q7ZFF0_9ACTN|nr:hypothetical protein [Krasilnikovia cinnamomea]RZU48853.1 hypothetical protein EV385_0582 [Krasilnikovia cinnamomea]
MTVEQSPDGSRRLGVFYDDDGQRRVEQVVTLDNGQTARIVHRHPDVLSHPYFVEGIDSEICLHQGQFIPSDDTSPDPLDGDVRFMWIPTPHILARGSRATRIEDFDEFGKSPVTTSIWTDKPELSEPSGSFRISDASSRPITEPPSNSARFEFSSRPQEVGSGPVDRIRFLIPNGWDSHDGHYVTSPDNLAYSWPGRLRAVAGDWSVTIDVTKQAGQSEFRKRLKASGGRAITHLGELHRVDGAEFSTAEAQPHLESIRLLLNLIAGRRVNLILPVGSKDEADIWAYWAAPPVDQMANVDSWIDATIACKQISEFLESGLAYCANSANQNVIKYATSYYVSANADVDVEPAIGLAISGLQLLAHHRLVNERNAYATSKAFEESGNTEKQVRELLTDCKINLDIPQHFPYLTQEAAQMPTQTGIGRDGIGAAIYLRNKIIHPTKSLPSNWSMYAWAEASILVRHYFRLSLLNILGYKGQHRSSVSPDRWVGAVEPVPWV